MLTPRGHLEIGIQKSCTGPHGYSRSPSTLSHRCNCDVSRDGKKDRIGDSTIDPGQNPKAPICAVECILCEGVDGAGIWVCAIWRSGVAYLCRGRCPGREACVICALHSQARPVSRRKRPIESCIRRRQDTGEVLVGNRLSFGIIELSK